MSAPPPGIFFSFEPQINWVIREARQKVDASYRVADFFDLSRFCIGGERSSISVV